MRFVILEDNHDRQAAMRACLVKRFPHSRIEFYEAAQPFIESLAKSMNDVAFIGLDHDLEMLVGEQGQLVDPGTGMDAVEWLCRQISRVPCGVHTTNDRAGTQMMSALQLAGWRVFRVIPYGDTEWIREIWWRGVRDLLIAAERH